MKESTSIPEQKNILFLISSIGGGGAERVACRLVSEFSKRHKVYLMYFDKKEKSIGEAYCLANIIKINFTFFRNSNTDKLYEYIDRLENIMKEREDESFTLGDLLDVYYGKKIYARYDKSVLQWNKFVKDFCADDATKEFGERLKAAATLWKIVRDSDVEKIYSRELLEKYRDRL